MKLLVIGGLSSDIQDAEALVELGAYIKETLDTVEVFATSLDKLVFDAHESFEILDTVNNLQLSSVDGIFIRGPKMRMLSAYAYYVSQFCLMQGIRCVNSYEAYYPGTKFAQSIVFMQEAAPFLRTLYSVDNQLLVSQAEQQLGYPFILKTNVGSHGDSNHLVRDHEEAMTALANEPNVDFLAQAYCPNDRDYRLLLVGDKDLVFERRGDADTHINNTSKGGEATRADGVLPPEIITLARKVSARLNLKISGVDVMPNLETGKLYFLEINSQPQLRTGALLPEKQALLKDFLTSFLAS
jgi:glutathione synthase/RimK-type ligase-like ATP-grasp enzyme